MSRLPFAAALLCLAAAAPRARAQSPAPQSPAQPPAPAQSAARADAPGSAVAATRPQYERIKGFLLRAAEQMPDSDYAYRPVASVRTGGELLAHLAAAQMYFCSAALRERNPAPQDLEKTTTGKAATLAALRTSFALCDRAYAIPDADALRALPAGPNGRPGGVPLSLLVLNVGHDNEHYGNLVTYLRLRGRVPPSSQPNS